MFNNVVLDVAIGVVFIFLLYSLLATSIQEAIATALALRARTLRDGIINGMLCNTPNITRWESYYRGIVCVFKYIYHIIITKPEVKDKKLGHYFYDHPMIKNYGSSRIFPIPSYLPTTNFSTILIDVLRQDFQQKLDVIIASKLPSATKTQAEIDALNQQLQSSTDTVKIKELLNYYGSYYTKLSKIPAARNKQERQDNIQKVEKLKSDFFPDLNITIEQDTWQILQMHLQNSLYNIDDFIKKLETWYDDSMNRVSGWYKRQVQFILFLIGIVIAATFNVDILLISGKLSTDKDARDQLVQLAVKEADTYKNDPRVSRRAHPGPDTSRAAYRQAIKDARKTIDTSIVKANDILAIGWGDYGKRADSVKTLQKYYAAEKERIADSIKKAGGRVTTPALPPSAKTNQAILDKLYEDNPFTYKLPYVLRQSFLHGRKFLGLLLTALAISLGAPFWFDSLSKLVNLRAAGKKEDSTTNTASSNSGSGGTSSTPQQPVNVNVNTANTEEEAVG
ncbi:hypothetical protein [Mucilaginibacter agri]|uniref:Uncharacterized protein n=1 Tax=Mucilaginibacter agri TaxID=2695265 RepID=A0A965ZH43_9SPHI|nr:hypothetical protein [Mucilaginibacter agri]NCD70968.1 hypothetical protein [Mucilaginibacter agri]